MNNNSVKVWSKVYICISLFFFTYFTVQNILKTIYIYLFSYMYISWISVFCLTVCASIFYLFIFNPRGKICQYIETKYTYIKHTFPKNYARLYKYKLRNFRYF